MQLILAYDSNYQTSIQEESTSPVRAWCLLNDAGKLEKQGVDTALADIFAQTQGHDYTTYVLFMGSDVLVTQVPRPAGSLRKLQQALPYLLEEQLADDVDELHFAVLNNDPENLAIGVINRELLKVCVDELSTAHLLPQVLMPLWLSLPQPAPGQWEMFVNQDYVFLRISIFSGFCIELAFAEGFLEALQQKNTPTQINCVTTQPLSFNIQANTTVLSEPTHWLEYVIKNLPLQKECNLLQGEFSTSQRSSEEQRWWTLAKRLGVCLVAVWFGGMLLQYTYLRFEHFILQKEIAVVYKEVFPNAKNMSHPRLDFEREISRVTNGLGGTDFLSMLLRSGEILADFPQVTLDSLSYTDQKITLNFTTDNFSRLQQLEERFRKAEIMVDKESAVSTKGIVQATWRIG